MGEAHGEPQVGPLELGAVADALDLEGLGEAVGDAHDHVVQERAGEAVEGAVGARIAGARDDHLRFFHGKSDIAGEGALELALRTLDGDLVAIGDGDLDTAGDGNGLLADAGHGGSYQT